MRKTTALFVALAGCLAVASTSMATLPCAANSSCAIEVENQLPCTNTDLRWCPQGDWDHIIIRVTVRNCLDNPLDSCDIRLDLSGIGDPQDEIGSPDGISICGSSSLTQMSDANGAVEFTLTGGGSGRFVLDWIVTAECAVPEVELCSNSDTLCAKSPDFTGNLIVNFWDTFEYLPQLQATVGWSGDFNSGVGTCDNLVTFWDTFDYLPHLQAVHQCTGFYLTPGTLGDCP